MLRKKIFPLVLLLALSLFLLCACGEGTAPGTETAPTTDPSTEPGTVPATNPVTAPVTEPKVISLEGISFSDTSFVYDGEEHALTVSGKLPAGVSVAYSDNKRVDAGSQTATATFSLDGAADVSLSAKLTITPARVDLSCVSWDYVAPFGYTGVLRTVSVLGLPDTVTVSYSDNQKIEIGDYHAVASFSPISDNYILSCSLIALDWSIVYCENYSFSVSGGTGNVPDGRYEIGEKITVNPDDPTWFLGWTVGGSVSTGGRFLTSSPTYSFELEADTALYANYTAHTNGTVVYDLCGGTVTGKGTGYYTTVFSSPFHYCYSTVIDNDTFSRSGYTLLEYNTEPDGSGTAVNPGGKVPVPDGAALRLYAVWGKWSDADDFTYTLSNGKATITGYKGNDPTLVIPASLGGYPVSVIANGAVVGKHFVTLSLPRTIKTVEKGAFQNCPNFDVFYLCDTMEYIYNESFTDCRAFTLFCYNAGMMPTQSTTLEGCFSVKFEQLLIKSGKTIAVVSGSSSLNGLNSEYLEELLGGEYHVINYGTNAMVSGAFYMEVCSHFMGEGDILINAPEYANKQYGSLDLGWKILRNNELCYNIFRYVDISQYRNVLPAITELNVTNKRLQTSTKSQTAYSSEINRHGDLICNQNHTNFSYGTSKTTLNYDYLNSEAVAGFNYAHKKLVDAGVRVYYSFPPIQEDVFNRLGDFGGYNAAVDEKLLYCSRISATPLRYLFTYQQMYNSTYHLTAAAARIRTELLAEDILAQLAKDAVGDTSKPAGSPDDSGRDDRDNNIDELDPSKAVTVYACDFEDESALSFAEADNIKTSFVSSEELSSKVWHIEKSASGFNYGWFFAGTETDASYISIKMKIKVNSAAMQPNPGESSASNPNMIQIKFGDPSPYDMLIIVANDGQSWYIGDLQSTKGGEKNYLSDALEFGKWYEMEMRFDVSGSVFKAELYLGGKYVASSGNYYDEEMKRSGFSSSVSNIRFTAQMRAVFSIDIDDMELTAIPKSE